jgi:uncharacterized Zn finger protein (UPF0148 family)
MSNCPKCGANLQHIRDHGWYCPVHGLVRLERQDKYKPGRDKDGKKWNRRTR